MTHYICSGTCQGVSERIGVCQTEWCPMHAQPLQACECQDGRHGGAFEQASLEEKVVVYEEAKE